MAVFNNSDDLVKHVITKTWNNGVSYTPKELGFPNNTPNASKKKTAANSLFAVKITDTDRREKYARVKKRSYGLPPNKKERLLAPTLLRTVRESFPS